MPTFSYRSATLAFAAALLAITACSKDDDGYPAPAVVASWMFDGQNRTSTSAWGETSADKVAVYISQEFATPNSKGSSVTVTLFIPKRVGTYTISPNSAASANFADLNTSTGLNNDAYSADAGSITISTLTTTAVSGTFTLTGKSYKNTQSTKSLTAGKFNVQLR